ncbi:hypothetical protein FAF44_01750 [Nonomuraea sp. MG754425]|uniref:hypothetical protein n=1 Tax=Nonomuraea sp. MG754425 TaxID=2570319 RepID=UPI001F3CAAC6|nr:hypothetical protein [Nonomuraea sp. MG754425]MCF6467138.1 hypothetical protein [Nonomuraea sp. MG754425]
MTGSLALVAALSAVASCGARPAAAPEPARHTASMTVLEGGGHGPQLCYAVMTSDPPQCDGPDVVGLDWAEVAHESSGGVKWGRYRLVGTWDGRRLTLTEPPGEPEATPAREPGRLDTPCPAPEGGWRAVDEATTTEKAMNKAVERARTAEDFAGAWFDRLDPAPTPVREEPIDAARHVVNLRFTGDLAARERWIREVWGGPLCLTPAERTEAELLAIQRDLGEEKDAGILATSPDPVTNRVNVSVWVVSDDLRRRLEDRYGAEAISIEGAFRPAG